MDNHESHLGLDVLEIAQSNGLSILTFPPHTSHRLQPLDVSVYGPLKAHYKKAVNEWNLSFPGKRITIYDLPECLSRAFYKAMTHENISAGFRKTGIWPMNSDVFSESDFVAVAVFDVAPSYEVPQHHEEVGPCTSAQPHDDLPTTSNAAVLDSMHL